MIFGDRYGLGKREDRYGYRSYGGEFPAPTGTIVTGLICGCVGFLVAALWTSMWSSEAIYAHTYYGQLTPAMLEGSNVRVKPYDVTSNQIKATLNSPTDNPDHLSIVKVGDKLTWTSVRDPNGFIRGFSHGADGLVAVSAESSQPNAVVNTPETTGSFKYSPGSKLGKNFGWHAHKICYTCDIVEVVGVPTPKGPMLIAPFVKWEGGWFIKHPVFGGVFLSALAAK